MNLHYAGYRPQDSGFGWAECNRHLTDALAKHFTLTDAESADVVFMPTPGFNFEPATEARAKINLGYAFFEHDLTDEAIANTAKYDVFYVGSSWCIDRLKERGVTNARVLIQGVERQTNQFPVIFSGGKFEYRKGHDLVILAFREFLKLYPGATMICAWHNPWQELVDVMRHTELEWPDKELSSQRELFMQILIANGIPQDAFHVLPQVSQAQLADEMRKTDFGLFPNRCEGGTNLVLMEYLALGKPAVTNKETGHADLHRMNQNLFIIPTETDKMGWAIQDVTDIVDAMERCVRFNGNVKTAHLPTWGDTAMTVFHCVEGLNEKMCREGGEKKL